MRKASHRDGREHETEISQGDVIVGMQREQVGDNSYQPERNNPAAKSRNDGHEQAGDDLNCPDGKHEIVRRNSKNLWNCHVEVLVPVDQEMEELVYTCDDRRDRKCKTQDGKGLVGRVVDGDRPKYDRAMMMRLSDNHIGHDVSLSKLTLAAVRRQQIAVHEPRSIR